MPGDSSSTINLIISAVDQASDQLKSIGENAKKMGEAFTLAGGVIVGALGIAVKKAADMQAAEASLNQSVVAAISTAKAQSAATKENADAKSALAIKIDAENQKVKELEANIKKASAGVSEHTVAVKSAAGAHTNFALETQKANQSISDAKLAIEKHTTTLTVHTATVKGHTASVADQALKQKENTAAVSSANLRIAEANDKLTTLAEKQKKSGQAHVLSAAQIEANKIKVAALNDQLDAEKNKLAALDDKQERQNNLLALATQNAKDLTDQMEKAAAANLKFGFNDDDTIKSLQTFFNVTHSVTEAIKFNQVAMDLARAKNIDLATATNYVALAMQGNGRALKQFGIDIKDAATPMEALSQLQSQVGGQAQAFAETTQGKMLILNATTENLTQTIGAALLPVVSKLIDKLVPLVTKLGEWIEAHPKLSQVVLITIAGLGVLLTTIGLLSFALSGVIGFITNGVIPAMRAFGVVMDFVAANPIILIIAGIVALGFAIYELIVHWDQVVAKVTEVWQKIPDIVKVGGRILLGVLTGGMSEVVITLFKNWDQIKSDAKATWDWIVSVVKTAVDAVKQAVQDLQNAWNAAKSVVSAPIKAVGGAVSSVGSAIGNFVTGRASGGQVDAGTTYLVGERGMELFTPGSSGFITPNHAMAGAGGNIVINISGNTLLDEFAGDKISQMIVDRLKRKNRLGM